MPTRATTATAVVTRIFRGSRKEAWDRENGRKESVSIEKAQEIILNHQVEDIENPTEIIIKAPISWLSKDVELRDTPGMDDDAQNGALEAVTLKALIDTDVCIFVYDASSMMSEKERERTVKIHRQMGGNVVYTINCTNRLNSIERIQEVENFSNSLFGSFESEISGMGKVYMMCSAPGMVDLDGFDEWLKELTKSDFLFSKKSRSFRSNIRSISIANQIAELQREISVLANIQAGTVFEKLEYLEEEHKRILKEKHFRIRQNTDEKVNELNEIFPKAIESLSFLDNLSERLEKCLDEISWKRKYAKNSANAVREMFAERYEMICNDYDGLFEVSDLHYIDDMMEFMDFPGSG